MTTDFSADCDWYMNNLVEVDTSGDENATLCDQFLTKFLSESSTTTEQYVTETQYTTGTYEVYNETETTTPTTPLSTYIASISNEFTTMKQTPQVAFEIEDSTEPQYTTYAAYDEPETTTPLSTYIEMISKEFTTVNHTTQINLEIDTSTKPYILDINEAATTEGNNTMEKILTNVTLLTKPDVMKVNNSLCEWYLPTIHQTPRALGNAGIALWVLGFVITFILIVLFAKQTHFICKTAHKSFRRHLYSITSVYVVMASLTSIGSGIPRAHAICSGVKDVYMAIGIGHFVDLTLAMYGGENVMAWHLKDKTINVRVIVVCKCFFCLPRCKVKRVSVTILKWLVWQMKWSQALYYLMKLIWMKSLENSLGIVGRENTAYFWYMHIINVISFLSGVFSLIIIGSLVTEDLQERYNYTAKAKLVRFTILTTKLQRLLFEILEASNVFPCYPPFVSQKFYKNVIKDFIYLVEVLILGTITFFVYMKRGEFEQGNPKEIPLPMIELTEELPEENGGFPVDDNTSVTVALTANTNSDSHC